MSSELESDVRYLARVAPYREFLQSKGRMDKRVGGRFDIQFNVQKSKCMVVSVRKWRSLHSIKVSDVCQFYLDGKPLEFVESYSHLGHIITSTLKDSSDIVFRRGRLIGQINSVLCYFGKLDSLVKAHLLKCFCYGLYGCELWDLDSSSLDGFCAA